MMMLLLALIPLMSWALELTQLEKLLKGLRSVKVAFVQRVVYPWTSKPQVSKGFFYAERGGRFRIEYEQPERTIIVSDGRYILIYSPSEKTAIRDRVDNNRSAVVEALFLMSKPLGEVFEAVGEFKRGGITTVMLKPKVKDEFFHRVYIDLEEGRIKGIRVEDKNGTSTGFEFISVSENFTPSSELFSTTIPEGYKIVNPW